MLSARLRGSRARSVDSPRGGCARRVALLAAALALGAGPALAQQSGRADLPQAYVPGGPTGGGGATLDTCLYAQPVTGVGGGFASQTFSDFAEFDCQSFDDFTVPAGPGWNVSGFRAVGRYTLFSVLPDNYRFEIYADDGSGAPTCGAPVFSLTVPGGTFGIIDQAGDITYATGATILSLAAGTYWLSVAVEMDFGSRGQWLWRPHATPHVAGSAMHFDNPGGGFGQLPCSSISDSDLAFCVLGASDTPQCPGSLYDQSSNNTGSSQASQIFADLPEFDCWTFDDFIVPGPDRWDVSGFYAGGHYFAGAGGADSVNFEIYADDGGKPLCGTPIFSLNVAGATADDGAGNFTYDNGGTLVSLCPGTYWLAVQAVMPYDPGGQWAWESHANPHLSGASARFDNPAGGFGVPRCAVNFDFDAIFCVFGTTSPCDEVACRAGNVGTVSGGAPETVMRVNGSAGDPLTRVVNAPGGGLLPITVAASSFGPATANWAFWIYDGEPSAGTVTPLQYKTFALGIGCLCLPVNLSAGLPCPCPTTIPLGRTSKSLRPAKAAAFCLRQPAETRTPATVTNVSFPAGRTFTVGGVLFDNGSPNVKKISIMNWVIVRT